jgi:hypothetical protein
MRSFLSLALLFLLAKSSSSVPITWTTYIDADCTTLPDGTSSPVVTVFTEIDCNITPDGSVSDLVCDATGISYNNYPHDDQCSSTAIPNTLQLGVCTWFPGPVDTWKLIEVDGYACDIVMS